LPPFKPPPPPLQHEVLDPAPPDDAFELKTTLSNVKDAPVATKSAAPRPAPPPPLPTPPVPPVTVNPLIVSELTVTAPV
jgi:hypothetical protein